jgi:rusticyanin
MVSPVFSGSSTVNRDPVGMSIFKYPQGALAAVTVIAVGGGAAVGGCGANSSASTASPAHASRFSSSSLAQSIGRKVGTALAGLTPQTVSTTEARALSGQTPAEASIDKAANQVVFTSTTVSLTVVAIPPGAPDMTFRVAGLTNPGIVVPRGAQVTVRFINADLDEAHGWLVTSEQTPFRFGQSMVPSVTGAFSGLIGDPVAGHDGASTITFQATSAGTYEYICPMPGHAQMGMHGTFIVR